MTEGVQASEDAAAARAAEQARLRKERREAKIKAGGAARLNRITGLGGGIQRDPQPQPEKTETATPATPPTASSTPSETPAADEHGDPEEVDISQHYYEPQTASRNRTTDSPSPSADQLRQMMMGLDRPSPGGGNPFLGGGGPPMPGLEGLEGMEEDPMMKMLSQMMSGAGGLPGAGGSPGSGGPNPFAGTGFEGLFSNGGLGGPNPMQQAAQTAANKTANLWRVLHAIFALGLGLYVALSTTFTGTRAERENLEIRSTGLLGEDRVEQTRAYFFYVFTSVEAILLTTRYFFDKDRSPPSGWMWTVSGFLPVPVKGYVQHALRYGQIFSTVRSDALVCVFVMGVCSWLRA
ncbi:hypothetical protein F5B20DRAFT_524911 [Whalleya microplaca]|nr:hypothetical protein F5B20DRAFT_524911 [Whalleya microplaca]